MEETKLYTCFEATNDYGEHVYMIYSAKVSDLKKKTYASTPEFTLEVVINGLASMGCGVLGSKIVLAGGYVTLEEDRKLRRGMITYDTDSKLVSHVDIPPMQGLKIRPLVFELYERLYVLNTSSYVRRRSFEIYYPKQKFWEEMLHPYIDEHSALLGNKEISGRTPYSWFVFGNCLCISLPKARLTYLHHARQISKSFEPNYDELLPFRGMATTYWQPGFSDVVVISFSKGRVEGRRLYLSPSYFGDPKVIFETTPYKPDGELSSYFADCGDGNFCLTTFDDVNIHVYMFRIHRHPDLKDGALNMELTRRVDHKYTFSDFSTGGNKSVSFLGCFALDDREKRFEEANLYSYYFSFYESAEKDYDIILPNADKLVPKKTKHGWDSDDSDSDVEMSSAIAIRG